MNTVTQVETDTTLRDTTLRDIAVAASFGVAILFIAGFASSATLHDTANDMRHAIGFACH